MPRRSKELPDAAIRRLRHGTTGLGEACKRQHAVGGVTGLYLQCMPPVGDEKIGSRQWILRITVGSKRKEIGLGGYPTVPAKKAREDARAVREDIKRGIDPIAAKKAAAAKLRSEQARQLSVREAATQYVKRRSQEFKTAKQSQRLRNQLDTYVLPYIGDMLIEDIEQHHLIDMLDHYYTRVPHTAIRVINHVEKIIQSAIINGKRKNQVNPAVWYNNLSLSDKFPDHRTIAPRKNQPAVEWEQLPDFMRALDTYDSPKGSKPESDCLAFAIHTVARIGEARLVNWADIDLIKNIWTIQPGAVKGEDRRKSDKIWHIPLTEPVIEILKSQPSYERQSGRIFSKLDNAEIPDSYFGSNINATLGFKGVAHGFRTTFKVWCQEHGVDDDASELCLKHVNTDSTRAAYARSQLFDIRGKLLTAWSERLLRS